MNKLVFTLFFIVLNIKSIFGTEPYIKTPSPVIYLENNLDEKDNLGYCLDTIGRGFADKLHAHSCKPRGGDVQFKYGYDQKRIQSATFEGKCVEVIDEIKNALVRFINSEDTYLQMEPMNSFRRRMVHKIGSKYKSKKLI